MTLEFGEPDAKPFSLPPSDLSRIFSPLAILATKTLDAVGAVKGRMNIPERLEQCHLARIRKS